MPKETLPLTRAQKPQTAEEARAVSHRRGGLEHLPLDTSGLRSSGEGNEDHQELVVSGTHTSAQLQWTNLWQQWAPQLGRASYKTGARSLRGRTGHGGTVVLPSTSEDTRKCRSGGSRGTSPPPLFLRSRSLLRLTEESSDRKTIQVAFALLLFLRNAIISYFNLNIHCIFQSHLIY